jgi:hypothetical protein
MRAAWSVAAGIAAASVVLAPAGVATAQPIAPGGAYQTIGQLEAQGYNVVIDRIGNAPLGECIVTNVRNPQEVTRTIFVGKGKDREAITVVVSRSITVSLNCDV